MGLSVFGSQVNTCWNRAKGSFLNSKRNTVSESSIEKLTNPQLPIVLIVLAAFGTVCFTIAAGIFLYRSDRGMLVAREWVEHTQEVLLTIEHASQQTDRIDSAARYYLATEDAPSLQAAQSDAIRLQTNALHLQQLVSDNRRQDSYIRDLSACSSTLARALNSAVDPGVVQAGVLQCRRALSLMTEQENQLLAERTETSSKRSQMSLIVELGFVAIAIAAITVLFSLLLRDAIVRARIARRWEQTSRDLEQSNRELAQTTVTLQRHAKEATLVAAFRDVLQLCTTVSEVYRCASVRLPQLIAGASGAFAITNNSRNAVETVAAWGETAFPISEIFPPDACCGLRAGHLRWRRPGESEIDCAHFIGAPPQQYLCVPLVAHGATLGVLVIECPTEEAMKHVQSHNESLRQLVHLTALAHASIELRNRLENQSIRDSLTGLFNRHFMQIALDREIARAIRRKNNLAVFMIDVDHFKEFNDRFSHAAGDSALREVSQALQRGVRAEDVVCRYGGEEFTVILPEITEEFAVERAENMRSAVADLQTTMGSDLFSKVTISIGIAIFPLHGNTPESLLHHADAALYHAKRTGRNRVCVASDGLVRIV